jgi:hypothetical protein
MDLSGEQEIAAPREKVWAALNDPEVLKASIPGCQSIEKDSDTSFAAKVKAKVGPVNATFSGNVSLSNINPPESYTISGEGSGGAAGFAKGGADVVLEDQGARTLLKYNVNAQVGGKLAQLGQRLIKSTANKYAKQFFENFTEQVAPTAPEAASDGEVVSEGETAAGTETPETPEAHPAESGREEAEAPPPGTAETPASAGSPIETSATGSASGDSAPARPGLNPLYWIGGVVALVLLLLILLGT